MGLVMTETVVETCADCLCVSGYMGGYVCNLRVRDAPRNHVPWVDVDDDQPPDWCPLRQGPVTIRLRVRS